MHNHLFWKLVINIARNSNPVEVKSKLKSIIKQKTTNSQNEFNDQTSKIMLSGAILFEESQLIEYFLGLNKQHTILSLEAFISYCLPLLIDRHSKHKSKHSPKQ